MTSIWKSPIFWDPKTMSDRCPLGASWCGDDRSLWGSESRSSMCPPVGFQVAHHLPADFVHPVPEKGASGCQFRTWQPVFSCNSHGFPRKCQLRRQVAASSFETNGFWIQIEPKLCIKIALCKPWIYMSHHDAAASETNSQLPPYWLWQFHRAPEFTDAFTPHWRENCKLRDVQFGGNLGDIDVHSGLERFFFLVVDLSLWKIWVHQLGWWHSLWKNKSHVPNHQPDRVEGKPCLKKKKTWEIPYRERRVYSNHENNGTWGLFFCWV